MRSIVLLLCLGLPACSSVDRISDLREAAPEWYEARKQELQGEGYPRLGAVPTDTTYRNKQASLMKTGAERDAIREAFFADPRSAPAYLTPAEIADWGRKLKTRVDSAIPPADFLTDQQIDALHARFSRPRARR